MVPINIPADERECIARTFGCPLGTLPMPYLGLPLGLKAPRFQDFNSLTSRIEKRLAATSFWLSSAGKLQIVNSVLSALPTYTMGMFQLPVKVIQQIDTARRHCLWRGHNQAAPSKSLVKWSQVCRPKAKGGLGVLNLTGQNNALLMKHLDKLFNRANVPWVDLIWQTYYHNGTLPHLSSRRGSAWWKGIQRLCPLFLAIAKPLARNGTTISLWFDQWKDLPLHIALPRLFSFARHHKCSLRAFLENPDLATHFFLPLSEEAFGELSQLQLLFMDIQHDSASNDIWNYIWGSEVFSTKKFYYNTYRHCTIHSTYRWLWACRCSNKLKVFFWLLLKDRLNTRNILRRKKVPLPRQEYDCPMCAIPHEETSQHLFFDCAFSTSCWSKIGLTWPPADSCPERVARARGALSCRFSLEILVSGAWSLWLLRNNVVFRHQSPSVASWLILFRQTILLQSFRLKSPLREELRGWADTL
ncbi:hypothetical protein GUJ93_ZPchr0003g17029 [Zizania palustris]|uniref:Reverse transcriptase zinc-binding domain-containing protein n=1 Tax=Zizania palustris TaxID=103762 RepID=A0A8J5SB01_ZIZPA|nr:hypothetical protein GUJ93_ZPchr0003g17029 [Zizania palustris]